VRADGVDLAPLMMETDQGERIETIDHRKTYLLKLSDALAWTIGPCAGADQQVGAWVDELASYLGLVLNGERPAREICFGRIRFKNNCAIDCRSSFIPPLPSGVPVNGWKEWGRAGAFLLRHQDIMDVFCGLYPSRVSFVERMRYALVPVFEELIVSGGLPIHGALVEKEGGGVLLLGKSGAGKTTCCRRLPSSWHIHSDDCALVVRSENGEFKAHPLPTWSAIESRELQWPCRINHRVVLRALFILEQSSHDEVEPLGGAMSVHAVKRACEEALVPFYLLRSSQSRYLRKHIFENAVSLARALSVFKLRVSLTGRFWEKIEEVLGQVGQSQRRVCSETVQKKEDITDLVCSTW